MGEIIYEQHLMKKRMQIISTRKSRAQKLKKLCKHFVNFHNLPVCHHLLTYTKFWFASCFHFSTFSFQHFDPFFILFNIWKNINIYKKIKTVLGKQTNSCRCHCKGLSVNDVTHFLRFLTPPSHLSPILLNRHME